MPILVYVIVGGICTWVLLAIVNRTQRRAARRRALAAPFPDEWEAILESNLPPYTRLDPDLRKLLNAKINVFMVEKSFEGCGGLELTDEIKVTIAAQACMLLLNGRDRMYPRLTSILVYPSTYIAGGKGTFGGQHEERSARLGESWNSGTVVLSWSNVKQGAFNFADGHNVTMHEFAHRLDQEDGSADGAPVLERFSAYGPWAKVLTKEFHELQKKKRKGKKSTLDRYGATNPAEFFAVATETFYEKPRQLKKKHPELYEELRSYYKVNPDEWV